MNNYNQGDGKNFMKAKFVTKLGSHENTLSLYSQPNPLDTLRLPYRKRKLYKS